MSLKKGENEQGLKKVLDLTRSIAIVILLLHFYYHGYAVFANWEMLEGMMANLTVSLGKLSSENIYLLSALLL